MRVGVVGYGTVGQATARLFNGAAVYDPLKGYADASALDRCQVVFICVPTPTLPGGECDLSLVYGSISEISPHIDEDRVVAIRSTVPPGTVRQLQETFAHAHFASTPEFLRADYMEQDALQPSRVVIGADTAYSQQVLLKAYRSRLRDRVPYVVTDSLTAEFIKYVANCFLATKISYAREIRTAARRLGAHYDDVVQAVGLDPRIGSGDEWWLEGLRDECLLKDLSAFVKLLRGWRSDGRLLTTVLASQDMDLAGQKAK
ncbi:MAG: hypothetical protein ACE5KW_04125 [Dehalococcoidia bacterium]